MNEEVESSLWTLQLTPLYIPSTVPDTLQVFQNLNDSAWPAYDHVYIFFKSLLNLLQYCFCFMFLVFWPQGMWDPSHCFS